MKLSYFFLALALAVVGVVSIAVFAASTRPGRPSRFFPT